MHNKTMAMPQMLPLHILLTFLLLHPASSSPRGIRLDLTHIDAAGNFTKLQLIERAAVRCKSRIGNLLANSLPTHHHPITRVRVPVFASGAGEYLIDLAIGTPARPFSAILDTGSDLIWTQCKPCLQCFQQPAPLFDPSRSSTFSKLPCSSELCQALPSSVCSPDCTYGYGYGDNSSTQGVLATETFTFGSRRRRASIPRLGFGCGVVNQGNFANSSGLVGFGRGPLSLISQLGIAKFSYCLTPFGESKRSPLLVGSLAKLKRSRHHRIRSTPMLRNPVYPSFYYLSLEGITVGATRLPIPTTAFALKENGTGGLIIDSGTTVTQLEDEGYQLVKKAFLSHVKLPIGNATIEGLDLCFSLPAGSSSAEVAVPKLIFHFKGADLDLQKENYMFEDRDSGLLCLNMVPSSGMSILGNLQQQNLHIRYDLKKERLSFVRAQCDRL